MYEIALVGDLHLAPKISSRIDDYFESLLMYKNIHCNCSFRIKNPE